MITLVREFENDDKSVENCNKGVEREVLVLLTLSGGKTVLILLYLSTGLL